MAGGEVTFQIPHAECSPLSLVTTQGQNGEPASSLVVRALRRQPAATAGSPSSWQLSGAFSPEAPILLDTQLLHVNRAMPTCPHDLAPPEYRSDPTC